MMLKTYQAPTMAEALAQVKNDLGREAVILHTRSVRKAGLKAMLRREHLWEVTASPHANVPARFSDGQYLPVAERPQDVQADQGLSTGQAPRVGAPSAEQDAGRPGPIVEHLGELRKMMESLLARPDQTDPGKARPGSGVAPELDPLRAVLLRQDVSEDIAVSLIDQLYLSLAGGAKLSDGELAGRLCDLAAARITTAGPAHTKPAQKGKPRVITLIGPTGVGKTTTIAKLAANYKLREHKRVALVTIDTYRIAAVDQLKTYAEIIEVPLRTVLSPHELQKAVYGIPDIDVVLIDTAGRSQNDSPRLNQLKQFLAAVEADEVHLVLAANASRRTQENIISRFAPLGANRILLTKLDEAETFGMILDIAASRTAPFSYVTTGQDVPDDFEPADAWRLAQRIVEGSESCSTTRPASFAG